MEEKIIALERSIGTFVKSKKESSTQTLLGKALVDYQKKAEKVAAEKKKKQNKDFQLKKYENHERARLSNFVAGSIYRIKLDDSHPLSFDWVLPIIPSSGPVACIPFSPTGGWNVGAFQDSAPVSGFTGYKLRERLVQSLAIGVEKVGKGQLIYMVDSPVFRGGFGTVENFC